MFRCPTVPLAVVAALALTLAGCSSEPALTGWIPHNGTINGVITATSAVPVPPRVASGVAARPEVGGTVLAALPALPKITSFTPRMRKALRPRLARGPRPTATPHDLIVTFRHGALDAPPIGSAALATAASARALGVAMRSRLAAMLPVGVAVAGVSPAILAARIRVADSTQREAVATALRKDPAIAAVTRNHLIWLDETPYVRQGASRVGPSALRTTPNDGLYAIQSWHYGLIDLPRAWSITAGSASVLVAVVDDGIRSHPDIAGNLTSDGYDFVNGVDSVPLCAGGFIKNADDGDGYDANPTIPASYFDTTGTCFDPADFGGHGLHVAGTIGAVGNDVLGVTGVNWTVRIRPIRVLGVAGFGETYDIAQGVLYAAGLPADNGGGGTVQPSTGARIINLSLGGPDDDPIFHDAVISATNAGALIVAAAGNDGTSVPEFPAAYPEVLAVAAVGPDAAPAPYSSFGSHVGIRAPGGNFDLGDFTDMVFSTMWAFDTDSPEYVWAEGTSMAAPHVAGVAALVLARDPALTPAALRTRLTSYAVGPATQYGAGLVNAYNSLTQTHGPATELYARLYSAATGAMVQTVKAQAGGAFEFTRVEDGTYLVYGGTDESGDQQIGVPGRLWGAFGGLAAPAAITVFAPGSHPASFAIGFPAQVTPNNTIATANALAIGGYVRATLVDTSKIDVYRVTIPAAGPYTFETSGWVGACGWALEEFTAIGLFDTAGNLLGSAGYIDDTHFNFCSRLTRSLGPSTYYVAVAGLVPGLRYRLQARAGS
ncbi:MAG TPA: S8 family serine peptidase [Gemmatimonadales bacterium]|nr:S8 family serine peptidase [Gemmatimonadales bacterium]